MTDERLEYINSLRDDLRYAKNQLAAWAGEGRGYEDSAYNGMASLLRNDKDLLDEIDNRLTSYLEEKIGRLQRQYESL